MILRMKIGSKNEKVVDGLQQLLRGVFMGAADVVPGVSGGTIALLLGIYERLVHNIHVTSSACVLFLKRDLPRSKENFSRIEWRFIVPLLLGILVSFIGFAQIIEIILEEYPRQTAGFFFGLVLASIVAAISMIDVWKNFYLLCIPLIAASAFFFLGLRAGPIANPSLIVFFISGAIAICAMILPGISGSFLLLMIGMYGSLIETVNNRELTKLTVFAFGAILSLGFSARGLNWLLLKFRDPLLAFLIALMIGSLRVIWPWPNGVGVVSSEENEVVEGSILAWPLSLSDFFWPTLFGIIGFIVVMSIWNFGRTK